MARTKINIRVSPDLAWLFPYIARLQKWDMLKKLAKIRSYRVPLGRYERTYGSITRHRGKFCISLCTKVQSLDKSCYLLSDKGTILETLAHELAHIIEWEHTPKHFELTARFCLLFSKVMKKTKIQDYYKEHI